VGSIPSHPPMMPKRARPNGERRWSYREFRRERGTRTSSRWKEISALASLVGHAYRQTSRRGSASRQNTAAAQLRVSRESRAAATTKSSIFYRHEFETRLSRTRGQFASPARLMRRWSTTLLSADCLEVGMFTGCRQWVTM